MLRDSKGHRSLSNKSFNGHLNPNWKGGRFIDDLGYVNIWIESHPRARIKHYVREHIIIYEKYYDCCLLKWSNVHHKDGNRQNNSIQNLEAMIKGKHHSLHNKGKQFTIGKKWTREQKENLGLVIKEWWRERRTKVK